jgi:hypothetical protein
MRVSPSLQGLELSVTDYAKPNFGSSLSCCSFWSLSSRSAPVLLPCARLEDLLLLLGPPPISLLLAMVRPLKPAPLTP